MIGTTKLTGARVFSKALARLFPVLAMIVVLAGCGGPPDASGIWEGEIEVPDEGVQIMTLDLDQGDEGRLFGTMRVVAEGDAPEEGSSFPLERGSVDDDGNFQVVAQSQTGLEAVEINVSGEVSGDSMDARLTIGGPSLPYQAERITEEEAYRRNAERGREARLAQATQDEQDDLMVRYNDLESEVEGRAYEVEEHLAVLEDAEGRGPEEQLLYALGPADPWECEQESVSCSVQSFAQRAESDRQDFEDPVGYSDPCETTADRAYYEGYDVSGEFMTGEYRGLRDELQGAASGASEDGDALVETAREMEAAREDAEDAGASTSPPDTPVAEAEDLAARAEESASGVEDALTTAEERYGALDGYADEVAREMVALRDGEGCEE